MAARPAGHTGSCSQEETVPVSVSVQRVHPDKSCYCDSNKAWLPSLKYQSFHKRSWHVVADPGRPNNVSPCYRAGRGQACRRCVPPAPNDGAWEPDAPGTHSGLGPWWAQRPGPSLRAAVGSLRLRPSLAPQSLSGSGHRHVPGTGAAPGRWE